MTRRLYQLSFKGQGIFIIHWPGEARDQPVGYVDPVPRMIDGVLAKGWFSESYATYMLIVCASRRLFKGFAIGAWPAIPLVMLILSYPNCHTNFKFPLVSTR